MAPDNAGSWIKTTQMREYAWEIYKSLMPQLMKSDSEDLDQFSFERFVEFIEHEQH